MATRVQTEKTPLTLITKAELSEAIAKRAHLPKPDVDLVLNELKDFLIEELPKNKKVETPVGIFKPRDYGWKGYDVGLQFIPEYDENIAFVPMKKVIREIRKNIKEHEAETV